MKSELKLINPDWYEKTNYLWYYNPHLNEFFSFGFSVAAKLCSVYRPGFYQKVIARKDMLDTPFLFSF